MREIDIWLIFPNCMQPNMREEIMNKLVRRIFPEKKQKSKKYPANAYLAPLCCAQALEPRILLDGAGLSTVSDQTDNQDGGENQENYQLFKIACFTLIWHSAVLTDTLPQRFRQHYIRLDHQSRNDIYCLCPSSDGRTLSWWSTVPVTDCLPDHRAAARRV